MIKDYFMITEKSNQLQVIMITDYDYPSSGTLWSMCDAHAQKILAFYSNSNATNFR